MRWQTVLVQLAIALALSPLVFYWATRSARRSTRTASKAQQGAPYALLRIPHSELQRMYLTPERYYVMHLSTAVPPPSAADLYVSPARWLPVSLRVKGSDTITLLKLAEHDIAASGGSGHLIVQCRQAETGLHFTRVD